MSRVEREERASGLLREMEGKRVMRGAKERGLEDFALAGLGRKVEMERGYDPASRRREEEEEEENKFGALMDSSDSEGEGDKKQKPAAKRNVFDFKQPRAPKLDFLLNPIDPDL